MLTIEDIRRPDRKSGFRFVGLRVRGSYSAYQAQHQKKRADGKPGSDSIFTGPSRATAEEAAQDYCDYVNAGNKIVPSHLRDSSYASGFKHVANKNKQGNYQAHVGTRPHFKGEKTNGWIGPRRPTAEQAAQDYCDRINGGLAQPGFTLKRVEKAPRPKRPKRVISAREREADRIKQEELAKNPPAPMHPPLCYLLGVQGDTYAVKVGESKTNVIARIEDELQTGNPRQLKLLATLPGGEETEQHLHGKYIAHNILNEWFRPTPELLSEFGLTVQQYRKRLSV